MCKAKVTCIFLIIVVNSWIPSDKGWAWAKAAYCRNLLMGVFPLFSFDTKVIHRRKGRGGDLWLLLNMELQDLLIFAYKHKAQKKQALGEKADRQWSGAYTMKRTLCDLNCRSVWKAYGEVIRSSPELRPPRTKCGVSKCKWSLEDGNLPFQSLWLSM